MVRLLAFSLAFGAAMVVGRMTRVDETELALVWPAAALSFLWLLTSWPRWSGVVVDSAVLCGVTVAVNLQTGLSLPLSLLFGVANTVQAVAACAIFFMVRGAGPPRLGRLLDLAALLAASVGASLLSALVGPAAAALAHSADVVAMSGQWVVRNAVSSLLLTALGLRLLSIRASAATPVVGSRRLARLGEHVLFALIAAALFGLVFGWADGLPITFFLLPLSIWAGVRFSTTLAAGYGVLSGAVTVFLTLVGPGHGPFGELTPTARAFLAQALVGVTGSVALLLALYRDGQLEARRALRNSEERFRLAFEWAPTAMYTVGLDEERPGRLLQVNPAFCRLLGYSAPELMTMTAEDVTCPDDAAATRALISEFIAGRHSAARLEKRYRRADGSMIWASASVAPARTTAGEPHLVVLVEDITARRDAEATLTRRALHDPLTGLANRRLLTERLQVALTDCGELGLIFLDLDGFKAVNDSSGHAAGDELLIQVAHRLSHAFRPGDTVARLGGDEFAVVCPGIGDPAALRSVAERLLSSVRAPFALSCGSVRITASVGVAVADDDVAAESLLGRADQAMYSAKRAGKDRVTVLAGAGHPPSGSDALAREFAVGLRNGDLIVHGQPIVDLTTGHPIAVEALARWRHPERGLLPPAAFLEAARGANSLPALDRRVLDEACRMGATWLEALGPGAPPVHLNLSAALLADGHLEAAVNDALTRSSLPAQRLVLEFSEAILSALDDAARQQIAAVRGRGVRIAVDDIGTGYTSLLRMTEVPADVLKIDVRFTAGIGRDPAAEAVVRAVVGMGQALGLSVVAEGVETPHQATRLRELGCETGQGHLFGSPRPEPVVLEQLRDRAFT